MTRIVFSSSIERCDIGVGDKLLLRVDKGLLIHENSYIIKSIKHENPWQIGESQMNIA